MGVLKSCQVVLAILTAVGSATGNLEDTANAGKSQDCVDFKMGSHSEEISLTRYLKDMIHECVMPEGLFSTVGEFHDANTTEQYQIAVMGFCQKRPTYNECISDQINIARQCLTLKTYWEMVEKESNFIQLLVEVACKQDGARLVNILMDENPRKTSSNYMAHRCFYHSKSIVLGNVHLLRQHDVQQYQLFMYWRECIFEQDTKFNEFVELLDEVIERLTCVDPSQGSVGPCKNIVDRECPVQSQRCNNTEVAVVTKFLKKLWSVMWAKERAETTDTIFRQ